MIVFVGDSMIPFIMEDQNIKGNPNTKIDPKYFLYNFMSPFMGGQKIGGLWPPNQLFQLYDIESVEFDQVYAKYLLENNDGFIAFMSPLMGDYYNGAAMVLTDLESRLTTACIESYIKLIQARYGYNASIAENEEELQYLNRDEMPDWGFRIFKQDVERYTYLTIDSQKVLENLRNIENENGKYI